MYIHVDGDGTPIIVDADGKFVDSPPLIQRVIQEDGSEVWVARYPETDEGFILEVYSAPIDTDAVFLYKGQDGSKTVVDADGKSVDSPPIIQRVIQNEDESWTAR